MSKALFKHLNKQQQKAVDDWTGPSLILAGAGSGKTRVLTAKVLHLIDDHRVVPDNVLMVTFTNKAAREMQDRMGKRLGFIGTFHSFCTRILRIYGEQIGLSSNFTIYDRSDQEALAKELLKDSKVGIKLSPGFILSRISSAKDRLIDDTQYGTVFTDEISQTVADLYKKYNKALKRNNGLDFDDLIFKTVLLLDKNQTIKERLEDTYRFMLVDEFHDTNYAQYMLIKYLGNRRKNVTVVGDFSQSIYSWRGAEIENIKKFENDFSPIKLYHLEENYRSTDNILTFAYNVISHNQTHPILKLFTKNGQGDEVAVRELATEQEEAFFVASEIEKITETNPFKSVAILYRINAQSRIIEEVFLHSSIPYVLIGGTGFYERREIKDLLSYIRLYVNPDDSVSYKRAVKIGKKRYSKFQKLMTYFYSHDKKLNTIDLIDKIIAKIAYLELFDENDKEDYDRLENIKELRSVALEFDNPRDFIEQVALVESEYSRSEKTRKNGVQMMTLHQAKGLEFPFVFIVGVEEGILPHSRSILDRHDLEEERRLFYVGITRAMKRLYITHSKKRFLFGVRTPTRISRFLEETDQYEGFDY